MKKDLTTEEISQLGIQEKRDYLIQLILDQPNLDNRSRVSLFKFLLKKYKEKLEKLKEKERKNPDITNPSAFLNAYLYGLAIARIRDEIRKFRWRDRIFVR